MSEKFPNPSSQENLEQRLGLVAVNDTTKRIFLDGKKVGVLACKDNGEYYSISFITIDEDLRGQGIGKFIYKKLAASLDKPLRSDLQLSDLAENLWRKFEAEGLAKQIDTAPNGKGIYEWIK
jgi:hypothetical protein